MGKTNTGLSNFITRLAQYAVNITHVIFFYITLCVFTARDVILKHYAVCFTTIDVINNHR